MPETARARIRLASPGRVINAVEASSGLLSVVASLAGAVVALFISDVVAERLGEFCGDPGLGVEDGEEGAGRDVFPSPSPFSFTYPLSVIVALDGSSASP